MTTAAYVDTSCLVAVALGEPGADEMAAELQDFSELFSSNLLEAELRSVFRREEVEGGGHFTTWLTWILPDRALGAEIERVLDAGCARGADAWHLATALYLVEDPGELPFVTLDARQAELAGALGFPVSGP